MSVDNLWVVIAKGKGALVREGADTSSPEASERLASLAVVEQIELQGQRLSFKLVSGNGPATGWVSTSASGKDLVVKAEQIWKVTGGKDSGGIVVREGVDTASALTSERLSFGALVRQLEVQGERVNYERLTGTGPSAGWVSKKLKNNKLLSGFPDFWNGVELEASAASGKKKVEKVPISEPGLPLGTRGDPIEIRMENEEKGFSYEGLPNWVPRAAAVKRVFREGKPYLPPDEPPLARLALLKPLPPFKKIFPKKLAELLPKVSNGDLFGLPIPRTADQMNSQEFGPEWFTNAFHAAGTLPADNKVTKVVVKEMDCTGFFKEGGAAMKAFITVEYLKSDPALHTELFAKYTWDFWRGISGIGSTLGQDDSAEVLANLVLGHLFPMRVPQTYFADISRENTSYIIISEKIEYTKRDGQEKKPYEVLPSLGKCQDHLLANPAEFYFCLFSSMGQLAGWDKLGVYDSFFGKQDVYNEEQFLAASLPNRKPQPKMGMETTKTVVGQTVDKMINFIMNWCPKIADPELRNAEKLEKIKKELQEMSPYFNDMSNFYQANNSDYIGLAHANLQADNSFFWRNEYEEVECGMLDLGGMGRSPYAARFSGCITGADADIQIAHLEGLMQSFSDETHRCGGPKLLVKELILRFHLSYITALYDLHRVVADHVYRETQQEEYLTFSGVLDERFQERFYTRCGSLPALNVWTYYVKKGEGNLKKVFDTWSKGAGKRYLTTFE